MGEKLILLKVCFSLSSLMELNKKTCKRRNLPVPEKPAITVNWRTRLQFQFQSDFGFNYFKYEDATHASCLQVLFLCSCMYA